MWRGIAIAEMPLNTGKPRLLTVAFLCWHPQITKTQCIAPSRKLDGKMCGTAQDPSAENSHPHGRSPDIRHDRKLRPPTLYEKPLHLSSEGSSAYIALKLLRLQVSELP